MSLENLENINEEEQPIPEETIDEEKKEQEERAARNKAIKKEYTFVLYDLVEAKKGIDRDNILIEKIKSKLGIGENEKKTANQKRYDDLVAKLESLENEINNNDYYSSAKSELQELLELAHSNIMVGPDIVEAVQTEAERRKSLNIENPKDGDYISYDHDSKDPDDYPKPFLERFKNKK